MAVRNALPSWETDFAPHLSAITHPTMIIWGEFDQVFPLAWVKNFTIGFVDQPSSKFSKPAICHNGNARTLVNRSLIASYIQPSP